MSQKTKKAQVEYTEQDYANMRSKMLKYYETEIPFLKLQSEYENLVAEIEESKSRKLMALAQSAQIHAAMTPDDDSKDMKQSKMEPND